MAKDMETITGEQVGGSDRVQVHRIIHAAIEAGGIVALAVVGASLLVLLLLVAVKAYVNGQPR